jgi:crossover junction endonuclease MUS81
MVFQHPNEAQQLNGIGAVLAKKLEERMMVYCEENGLPMPTRRKGNETQLL